MLLSGAAVDATPDGLIGSQRQYPSAVAISVAGGTGNSTIYLVDGAFNNDPVNNIGQPMPFPDALEEFKVETGVRPARYGIYTGATVNAVTKAGTNSLPRQPASSSSAITASTRRTRSRIADDGLNRNQYGRHARRADQAEPDVLLRRAARYARNRQRPSGHDSRSCRPRRCWTATSRRSRRRRATAARP